MTITISARRWLALVLCAALPGCVTVTQRRPVSDMCAEQCVAKCNYTVDFRACIARCEDYCGVARGPSDTDDGSTTFFDPRMIMNRRDPAIAVLNANVIGFRDCPLRAQVGTPVKVSADIRLRLLNRHTTDLDVSVRAYIEKATTAPDQVRWVDLGVIRAPVGEMDKIRSLQLSNEFLFALPESATLEAVCQLDWQLDGAAESMRRGTSCTFAVVVTLSSPAAAARIGAANA